MFTESLYGAIFGSGFDWLPVTLWVGNRAKISHVKFLEGLMEECIRACLVSDRADQDRVAASLRSNISPL
jgi:hypothetical protein